MERLLDPGFDPVPSEAESLLDAYDPQEAIALSSAHDGGVVLRNLFATTDAVIERLRARAIAISSSAQRETTPEGVEDVLRHAREYEAVIEHALEIKRHLGNCMDHYREHHPEERQASAETPAPAAAAAAPTEERQASAEPAAPEAPETPAPAAAAAAPTTEPAAAAAPTEERQASAAPVAPEAPAPAAAAAPKTPAQRPATAKRSRAASASVRVTALRSPEPPRYAQQAKEAVAGGMEKVLSYMEVDVPPSPPPPEGGIPIEAGERFYGIHRTNAWDDARTSFLVKYGTEDARKRFFDAAFAGTSRAPGAQVPPEKEELDALAARAVPEETGTKEKVSDRRAAFITWLYRRSIETEAILVLGDDERRFYTAMKKMWGDNLERNIGEARRNKNSDPYNAAKRKLLEVLGTGVRESDIDAFFAEIHEYAIQETLHKKVQAALRGKWPRDLYERLRVAAVDPESPEHNFVAGELLRLSETPKPKVDEDYVRSFIDTISTTAGRPGAASFDAQSFESGFSAALEGSLETHMGWRGGAPPGTEPGARKALAILVSIGNAGAGAADKIAEVRRTLEQLDDPIAGTATGTYGVSIYASAIRSAHATMHRAEASEGVPYRALEPKLAARWDGFVAALARAFPSAFPVPAGKTFADMSEALFNGHIKISGIPVGARASSAGESMLAGSSDEAHILGALSRAARSSSKYKPFIPEHISREGIDPATMDAYVRILRGNYSEEAAREIVATQTHIVKIVADVFEEDPGAIVIVDGDKVGVIPSDKAADVKAIRVGHEGAGSTSRYANLEGYLRRFQNPTTWKWKDYPPPGVTAHTVHRVRGVVLSRGEIDTGKYMRVLEGYVAAAVAAPAAAPAPEQAAEQAAAPSPAAPAPAPAAAPSPAAAAPAPAQEEQPAAQEEPAAEEGGGEVSLSDAIRDADAGGLTAEEYIERFMESTEGKTISSEEGWWDEVARYLDENYLGTAANMEWLRSARNRADKTGEARFQKMVNFVKRIKGDAGNAYTAAFLDHVLLFNIVEEHDKQIEMAAHNAYIGRVKAILDGNYRKATSPAVKAVYGAASDYFAGDFEGAARKIGDGGKHAPGTFARQGTKHAQAAIYAVVLKDLPRKGNMPGVDLIHNYGPLAARAWVALIDNLDKTYEGVRKEGESLGVAAARIWRNASGYELGKLRE